MTRWMRQSASSSGSSGWARLRQRERGGSASGHARLPSSRMVLLVLAQMVLLLLVTKMRPGPHLLPLLLAPLVVLLMLGHQPSARLRCVVCRRKLGYWEQSPEALTGQQQQQHHHCLLGRT